MQRSIRENANSALSAIKPITEEEFNRFRALIYDVAGIAMSPEKRTLVAGRLGKRLTAHSLETFSQYYRLVTADRDSEEFQIMVDLLTTNETYFFREPQHFDFLKEQVLKQWKGKNFRIWSAASSSGEEVYSLAMVLAEYLGSGQWEIIGSDLNSKVLEQCRRAVYTFNGKGNIPVKYLHRYCLKGVREREGSFIIQKKLRSRCSFYQINLMKPLPEIGMFDVIFIRNVMIYFDKEGKVKVIDKLLQRLKTGGVLIVSHSESLHGLSDKLAMIKPSIYRKR